MLAGLFQQVGAEGGPVHHRGHPYGDDGDPHGLGVEGEAVISHAGAGGDARVTDLDRGAEPLHPPGGQSVHGDDGPGGDLVGHRLDDLSALHPRGAQHPRRQSGHGAEAAEVLGGHGDEVAGHQSAVGGLGSHGIGGDGPVAKAHHQHLPLSLGEQRGQKPGQSLYRPGEGPLLPPAQTGQV